MQQHINSHQYRQLSKEHSKTRSLWYVMVLVLLFGCIFIFRSVHSHALSSSSPIKSAITGACLDDRHDSSELNNAVDIWSCNDTAAQDWSLEDSTITHSNSECLAVRGNSKSSGTKVVSSSCNGNPGQVWLRDKGGFMNPNSGLCLNSPSDRMGAQLDIASCDNITQSSEIWTPTNTNNVGPSATCEGTERQKVVCNAEKEWSTWQSGTPTHEALLTQYTDGAPYEEWCADFVSYIYQEAGYPFTQGEADGWDENIADNIQNMGFTKHATSGYTPQAGDVAYFDYTGGHVEIVVSGGENPTFIYGDSARIDPATDNGQMEANTITHDGPTGKVIYYLSPNGS